jgi:hypothetical protein
MTAVTLKIMRILRLLLALAGLLPAAAMAVEAPVLAVLEYESGLLGERTPIRVVAGNTPSPYAGKPRAVWTLLAGDTVQQAGSPPLRMIRFFRHTGSSLQLVCAFAVKYIPSPKGWRPAYLLLQQPAVAWDGEKFVPLAGSGNPHRLIQVLDPPTPEAEGFYYYNLRFGFGANGGPIQIDAWDVQ